MGLRWLPPGWHLLFLIRGSTIGLFWGGGGSGAASSGHFRPNLGGPGRSGPEFNIYIFNSCQTGASWVAVALKTPRLTLGGSQTLPLGGCRPDPPKDRDDPCNMYDLYRPPRCSYVLYVVLFWKLIFIF